MMKINQRKETRRIKRRRGSADDRLGQTETDAARCGQMRPDEFALENDSVRVTQM